MKIVVYGPHWNAFWSIPQQTAEYLQSQFPQHRFVHPQTEPELEAQIQNADVFFGYRLDSAQLQVAAKLKWFHIPAANVWGIKLQELKDRNIILTNARGMHARPIAEHVIGCMLVFARKFTECWEFKKLHHYGSREILSTGPPLSILRDQTVVVLGLGAIGGEVARLCSAFGMRVLAIKRYTKGTFPNIESVYGPHQLHEALPQADFLVICAARTPQTDRLLGEQELSLMKPSAVLINVARAAIVQRDALLKFLSEGRIRGAALDVFYQEPLPPDSELFDLPNVFLTPHLAGVNAPEHWNNAVRMFAENLTRFTEGRPMNNVVDFESGY